MRSTLLVSVLALLLCAGTANAGGFGFGAGGFGLDPFVGNSCGVNGVGGLGFGRDAFGGINDIERLRLLLLLQNRGIGGVGFNNVGFNGGFADPYLRFRLLHRLDHLLWNRGF